VLPVHIDAATPEEDNSNEISLEENAVIWDKRFPRTVLVLLVPRRYVPVTRHTAHRTADPPRPAQSPRAFPGSLSIVSDHSMCMCT
jgi:hypothetical protein